jgi:type IV secretion system protein VirB4
MTAGAQFWARERAAGQRLPYAAMVNPHTLLLRDGRLAQFVRLDGFLFETAETDEINYRKQLRDAMLQAVGTSRIALYHHVIRRAAPAPVGGAFPDAFSARLDGTWTARLASRRLFVNEIVLTLVRGRASGRGDAVQRLLDRLRGEGGTDARLATIMAEVRALDAAREAITASLSAYGPRLLGQYDTDHGPCSAPLEFLSELYNGQPARLLLPEDDVGEYLTRRRVSFGTDVAELSAAAGIGCDYVAMIGVKDYPGHTLPGMLDEVLRLPQQMVVTQSFGFADRQESLGRVNLALRRMRAADDEAVSLRGDLMQARDELAAGRTVFGRHHLTLALRAAAPAELDRGVAEVQALLADLGIVAVREDLALETAFWAQFPGNEALIPRPALIAGRNFASLASSHNFPHGRARRNHWGEAVTVLETSAAGPYHFNFHQGDLGNFTIIGPSGSGKTVVLNFLLAQARRYDPRIVFFDKDRGAELFLRAIGGRYDVLRPGASSGLNPLRLPDTPENRRFLADWLARLVSPSMALEPEEAAQIDDAIAANMLAPVEFRKLRHLASLFRGGDRPHAKDLYARLAPWWGTGERAWLFDNAEDRTDLQSRVIGFDMTRILDDPIMRTPAMMYLFHRVEERLDGSPSIIVVDEGWKALDDPVFVARIRDWEKTIRKRNGIVGFATQSAEDALSSSIASAIVEQAATQIFMANPRAQAEHYIDGFGLTRHEYELVRGLPDSARAFLVRHGRHSVLARLNLDGERELLTILSGRERTVRLLDDIRVETGDDPAAWIPRLMEATD